MRKSIRLSSTGLAVAEDREPVNEVRNFSTRFSLTSYVKRVQHLTDEQKSAIGKMGFGNLLLVPNHSLSKTLLTELMERWSCEKQAFVLDSGEIQMTLLDVALILGLRIMGNPVVLKEDEPFSDLEEEYGATKGKRKLAMNSLETRLDSLGETVSEDFIRTFLLYTLGTFLSSNGKVDSRYLSFLTNLGDVYQFAWGAAVIEDLCLWLDKRKANNVQYVGGCLIFLQTWSYEHFDIARPNLLDHGSTFPRVCRWENSKYSQRQRLTSRFKALHDDQVIWTLQPTSGELQLEVIREALEWLDDNMELQSALKCSTSISIDGPHVDAELQHSISSEVDREEEVNFDNQAVKGTPTKLSTSDYVRRELETNLENLIVEDTPTSLSICDNAQRDQEINLENVIVEDTPTSLSTSDDVRREQEINLQNLIVKDTPTSLSICDEAQRDQEINLENLIVEDRPSLSTSDDVHREQEINLENLIVEYTPTSLSICEELQRDQEINLKNLIVEDTPTSLSKGDDVCREQEFIAEELIVEGSVTDLSFCDDDLRKRNVMLEEENVELKMKVSQVMEENRLLCCQVSSTTQFEGQNTELKKEVDLLREENRNLRLLIDRFLDSMYRNVSDYETNAIE